MSEPWERSHLVHVDKDGIAHTTFYSHYFSDDLFVRCDASPVHKLCTEDNAKCVAGVVTCLACLACLTLTT